ncbi:MAG: Linear gramicidin synthase subunit D [Chroococcidiopsis sp. SAG 2025]|uniref:non-ribosomal peptide synthetase n=1 Tax=Chroococcidiopsis sp. SAG 2025 TaxID=171389 RepID=UPI002937341F|nr:amino acid adenylation domain-containing protein [Chroococcidiopsis sp. SAG 2025]MDV2992197.1 Linear gramicidin synthase subunit D [Chroococcidiopsis sp. SAG 2025]
MNIDEFLSYCRSLDVKIWLDGERLRYSAPSGTLTPEFLAEMRSRKAEILKCLHKTQIQPICPAARNGDLPLSFAQQRIWFLEQMGDKNAVYNLAGALKIEGTLDVAALEQSLREIIQRHEILRTNFAIANGQPTQVISPGWNFTLPVVDLRSLSAADREVEMQRLITAEQEQTFDLTQGALWRWKLLQLEQNEYFLLVVIHHIIADAWTFAVIFRELQALYTAFASGKPSPLPDLPIQYADFAVWQRQRSPKEVLETELSYWQQQLDGAPTVLQLPSDRPRPPVQTYRGATQVFTLPSSLTAALKSVSQQAEATLFMTLLAAFNILLHRYTGAIDLLVGSPIANRDRAETEPLVGFFVNTLVLRTDLSGNPSFRELLKRVREVALGAYTHQNLPFEKLVEALSLERDLSYSPLFQVMFVFQNVPIAEIKLPDLTMHPVRIDSPTAQFDLTLDLTETKSGLIGRLEYNTDLFDAETIARMVGHFQTLLEGIVADCDRCISDLPILTSWEWQQLLEWNRPSADDSKDICIHQLFAAQVERTPDAVAVVLEDKQLTYLQLDRQANQLARYLKKLGVKPETLVGICVERSLEMVVGLLGILKAGGAYVPLDPAYPQERLAWMIADSGVTVLLTQKKLLEYLPEHQAHTICLDADWQAISQESEENPASEVKPENLAYVIYTSGSTGKPKGVAIQHQSLVSFTKSAIVEYEIDQCDRVLQFASLSFDVAAEEIYPCLSCGGTLVLRTEEMLTIATFVQKCWDWGLTVLDLPTAYWHQLTTELANANLTLPDSLRLVIFGGERALPDKLSSWYEYVGDRPQLINAYGPTETTVEATICKLSHSHARSPQFPLTKEAREIPIGRPMPHVQVYVLDRYLQPVPIGIPGELYIGGAGVARGYLNRPELTQERFIPNPWEKSNVKIQNSKFLSPSAPSAPSALFPDSPVRAGFEPRFIDVSRESFAKPAPTTPDSRLYKTGDLARYLPDGNIEFLGRIDRQVKIRGFRVELGEIEAILAQHPKVREIAVTVWEDHLEDKRLVAYIVPSQGQILTTNELQSFLKEKLPNYLLPSAFVMLETMPLTPNGKLDRHALPAPTNRPELVEAYVMPQTETERVIAAVWQEMLQLEKVGIDDNFFNLGGHSLLLVKVQVKLNQMFDRELSVIDMFKYPTIKALANYLNRRSREELNSQLGQNRATTRSDRASARQQKRQFRQMHRATNERGGSLK